MGSGSRRRPMVIDSESDSDVTIVKSAWKPIVIESDDDGHPPPKKEQLRPSIRETMEVDSKHATSNEKGRFQQSDSDNARKRMFKIDSEDSLFIKEEFTLDSKDHDRSWMKTEVSQQFDPDEEPLAKKRMVKLEIDHKPLVRTEVSPQFDPGNERPAKKRILKVDNDDKSLVKMEERQPTTHSTPGQDSHSTDSVSTEPIDPSYRMGIKRSFKTMGGEWKDYWMQAAGVEFFNGRTRCTIICAVCQKR
ncbi:uncharacterized protein EI97DRAFT_433843 [Westerdykella ornata]|uniref:Uncharacterized protein n=1 Tax=Westerdykella ornata TaxID=318751 RepID=A0A6A6JI49_WESOR|nr:uncharacterized protein EI97DRAFT_433843 [Westerdykella ornata]KAF2275905.1 hypothetical protein EI97DRAFT_433843 [Westerdykella ornata]